MEFIIDFQGVRPGDIYPTYYVAGQECPPELEEMALEIGAIEQDLSDEEDMYDPEDF